MFWNNDWIKTRFTVPGNIQGDISDIGLKGFLAKAVPISSQSPDRLRSGGTGMQPKTS